MNSTPPSPVEIEFSRPVMVEALSIGDSRKRLEATPEECAALAERFGLLTLQNLTADLMLHRSGHGKRIRITLKGTISADLSQTCVVTLDPVAARIEAEVETIFDSEADEAEEGYEFDDAHEDPGDPIIDGGIDLGETVAQFLALEIDPFPRKEGVDEEEMKLESKDSSPNPFAVLEKLKNQPK